MNAFQITLPCGSLPINLVCISNATIAVLRNPSIPTVCDTPANGAHAVFTLESFHIGNGEDAEEFQYNVPLPYKEIPKLLEYLKQQCLEMPTFN